MHGHSFVSLESEIKMGRGLICEFLGKLIVEFLDIALKILMKVFLTKNKRDQIN